MSREPVRASGTATEETPPAGLVVQTLADYRGFTLTAVCGPCERYVELEHAALAGRFGWDVALGELRRRLTCRRCGARTGRVLVGAARCAEDGNNHSQRRSE